MKNDYLRVLFLHYITSEITSSYQLELIQCPYVTKRSPIQIAVQTLIL